jgi:hypothetical protein
MLPARPATCVLSHCHCVQAKARLASGLQPHPFLAPRSRAVAGACAAPEGGAGACVAREGGAGVTLPLPPALPAIHVLQVPSAHLLLCGVSVERQLRIA